MTKMIESPDTRRENRIPPGQRVTEKWPVLQYGDVRHVDIEKWRFTIFGLVEERRTFDIEEFMSLPRVKVFSDIHCVTGWSKLNNMW
ncbi:MAG: molybdopterin-dependent oxidoreductase, partial [Theionarchaea archaeon]|nr:molybdopterin-dependent oxidoreductase [Theionarchaea archaeon]